MPPPDQELSLSAAELATMAASVTLLPAKHSLPFDSPYEIAEKWRQSFVDLGSSETEKTAIENQFNKFNGENLASLDKVDDIDKTKRNELIDYLARLLQQKFPQLSQQLNQPLLFFTNFIESCFCRVTFLLNRDAWSLRGKDLSLDTLGYRRVQIEFLSDPNDARLIIQESYSNPFRSDFAVVKTIIRGVKDVLGHDVIEVESVDDLAETLRIYPSSLQHDNDLSPLIKLYADFLQRAPLTLKNYERLQKLKKFLGQHLNRSDLLIDLEKRAITSKDYERWHVVSIVCLAEQAKQNSRQEAYLLALPNNTFRNLGEQSVAALARCAVDYPIIQTLFRKHQHLKKHLPKKTPLRPREQLGSKELYQLIRKMLVLVGCKVEEVRLPSVSGAVVAACPERAGGLLVTHNNTKFFIPFPVGTDVDTENAANAVRQPNSLALCGNVLTNTKNQLQVTRCFIPCGVRGHWLLVDINKIQNQLVVKNPKGFRGERYLDLLQNAEVNALQENFCDSTNPPRMSALHLQPWYNDTDCGRYVAMEIVKSIAPGFSMDVAALHALHTDKSFERAFPAQPLPLVVPERALDVDDNARAVGSVSLAEGGDESILSAIGDGPEGFDDATESQEPSDNHQATLAKLNTVLLLEDVKAHIDRLKEESKNVGLSRRRETRLLKAMVLQLYRDGLENDLPPTMICSSILLLLHRINSEAENETSHAISSDPQLKNFFGEENKENNGRSAQEVLKRLCKRNYTIEKLIDKTLFGVFNSRTQKLLACGDVTKSFLRGQKSSPEILNAGLSRFYPR